MCGHWATQVRGRDGTDAGTGVPSSSTSEGRAGVRGLNPGQRPLSALRPRLGVCRLAGPARVSAQCFFSRFKEIVPSLPHLKCLSPSSLHVSATCCSLLGRSPSVLEGTRISSSASRKCVRAFGPLSHVANACDSRSHLPRSYRFPVFLPHIKYLCFLIYFPPAH